MNLYLSSIVKIVTLSTIIYVYGYTISICFKYIFYKIFTRNHNVLTDKGKNCIVK